VCVVCVCGVCVWCVCVRVSVKMSAGTHIHTERTHTHQLLCCRITTLTFTFLTNFKISNFNKEHTSMSSLKMIWIRSKHFGALLSVLMWTF